MTLGRLHLFDAVAQQDGTTNIRVFRRDELRELKLVGIFVQCDKAVEVRKFGEILCEALDRELVSRPQA